MWFKTLPVNLDLHARQTGNVTILNKTGDQKSASLPMWQVADRYPQAGCKKSRKTWHTEVILSSWMITSIQNRGLQAKRATNIICLGGEFRDHHSPELSRIQINRNLNRQYDANELRCSTGLRSLVINTHLCGSPRAKHRELSLQNHQEN